MATIIHLSLLLVTTLTCGSLPALGSENCLCCCTESYPCVRNKRSSANSVCKNANRKCFLIPGNSETGLIDAITLPPSQSSCTESHPCVLKNCPTTKDACKNANSRKCFLISEESVPNLIKCPSENSCTESCPCVLKKSKTTKDACKNAKKCFLIPGNSETGFIDAITLPPSQSNLTFYNETKSWIDALRLCRTEASSLVEITDEAVMGKVESLLRNFTGLQQAWIGLERSIFGSEAPWQWISAGRVNVSHWNSTFPVDRLNNHCGKIVWNDTSESYKWLDGRCHDELPFICQGFV